MKNQSYIQTTELRKLASEIDSNLIDNAIVCEFTSYDDTPTLHVYLWRAFGLSDLPERIRNLKLAAEGIWDGGTVFSFQI